MKFETTCTDWNIASMFLDTLTPIKDLGTLEIITQDGKSIENPSREYVKEIYKQQGQITIKFYDSEE